jgi:hypothetical protein
LACPQTILSLTVDARCGEICGVHGRVGARAPRMRGQTILSLAVDARCGEICGVHGRVGARAGRMRGRTLTGLGPELTGVGKEFAVGGQHVGSLVVQVLDF